VDCVEHHGEKHLGFKRCSLGEEHYLDDKRSRIIGEWLDLCGIDLYRNGVRWPRDKLDKLLDIRSQPKQTSGQCIAWQIFKDDRAAHLPPFEELVSRLDIDSCRDAYLSSITKQLDSSNGSTPLPTSPLWFFFHISSSTIFSRQLKLVSWCRFLRDD
jgi:hypothetical protein